MAIHYKIDHEQNLLNVKAWGKDDDLQDVLDYGMAVIKAAQTTRCLMILCDETDLIYSIGTVDTFESAKFIADKAPHVVRIAIVCNPEFISDAAFWENVAVNRGLCVRAFTQVTDAKVWLGGGGCEM